MSRFIRSRKAPILRRLIGYSELARGTVNSPRACPAGTHEGYLGKYCWHDGERERTACPAGTHIGYEGKYCWCNH
jgi:hypothetical protein